MAEPNLKSISTKADEDKLVKMMEDQITKALKTLGDSMADSTIKTIKSTFEEHNNLFTGYFEKIDKQNKMIHQQGDLILKQAEIMDNQQKQIKELKDRLETMEELLFDVVNIAAPSEDKVKLLKYGLREFAKNGGRF